MAEDGAALLDVLESIETVLALGRLWAPMEFVGAAIKAGKERGTSASGWQAR